MKVSWYDLSLEERLNFGNGCTWVPEWVFTPSCRVHDLIWSRGCGANRWYENIWKAPYYYTRGNWHFFVLMWGDCRRWYHYPTSAIYFVGVMLFSWPWFKIGRWRTKAEILQSDRDYKDRLRARTRQSI